MFEKNVGGDFSFSRKKKNAYEIFGGKGEDTEIDTFLQKTKKGISLFFFVLF